jgi:hypothetical protein
MEIERCENISAQASLDILELLTQFPIAEGNGNTFSPYYTYDAFTCCLTMADFKFANCWNGELTYISVGF